METWKVTDHGNEIGVSPRAGVIAAVGFLVPVGSLT